MIVTFFTALMSLLLATSCSGTLTTVANLEFSADQFTGVQGWRLVRYLPEDATNWHPVDDDLKGTADSYGSHGSTVPAGSVDQPNDKLVPGAWNLNFEATVPCFDEFLFTEAKSGFYRHVWCPTSSVWNNDIPYTYSASLNVQSANAWTYIGPDQYNADAKGALDSNAYEAVTGIFSNTHTRKYEPVIGGNTRISMAAAIELYAENGGLGGGGGGVWPVDLPNDSETCCLQRGSMVFVRSTLTVQQCAAKTVDTGVAQNVFAELRRAAQKKYAENLATSITAHDGWRLVRFNPASVQVSISGGYSQGVGNYGLDALRGEIQYNEDSHTAGAWSEPFGEFDEIFIGSALMDKWVHCPRFAVSMVDVNAEVWSGSLASHSSSIHARRLLAFSRTPTPINYVRQCSSAASDKQKIEVSSDIDGFRLSLLPTDLDAGGGSGQSPSTAYELYVDNLQQTPASTQTNTGIFGTVVLVRSASCLPGVYYDEALDTNTQTRETFDSRWKLISQNADDVTPAYTDTFNSDGVCDATADATCNSRIDHNEFRWPDGTLRYITRPRPEGGSYNTPTWLPSAMLSADELLRSYAQLMPRQEDERIYIHKPHSYTCSSGCQKEYDTYDALEGCTACLPGSYNHLPGTGTCSTCPHNTSYYDHGDVASSFVVQDGSVTAVGCACRMSFAAPTMTNNAPCEACGVDEYKLSIGPEACQVCIDQHKSCGRENREMVAELTGFGGWTLVRHLPRGGDTWFEYTDALAGSEAATSGGLIGTDAAWTTPFLDFDEYFICNADMTVFVYFSKHSLNLHGVNLDTGVYNPHYRWKYVAHKIADDTLVWQSRKAGVLQGATYESFAKEHPGSKAAQCTDDVDCDVKELQASVLSGKDGWRLVRYLPENSINGHPINDGLAGVQSYIGRDPIYIGGVQQKITAGAWSVPFGQFDEFFISDVAMGTWVYCNATDLYGQRDTSQTAMTSTGELTVKKSSLRASTHSVEMLYDTDKKDGVRHQGGKYFVLGIRIDLKSERPGGIQETTLMRDHDIYTDNSYARPSTKHTPSPPDAAPRGSMVFVRDSTLPTRRRTIVMLGAGMISGADAPNSFATEACVSYDFRPVSVPDDYQDLNWFMEGLDNTDTTSLSECKTRCDLEPRCLSIVTHPGFTQQDRPGIYLKTRCNMLEHANYIMAPFKAPYTILGVTKLYSYESHMYLKKTGYWNMDRTNCNPDPKLLVPLSGNYFDSQNAIGMYVEEPDELEADELVLQTTRLSTDGSMVFVRACDGSCLAEKMTKITGIDGWKLVRFMPRGSTDWHEAADSLQGTAVYGIANDKLAAWSVNFNEAVPFFNEYLISDGGLRNWVYFDKQEVFNYKLDEQENVIGGVGLRLTLIDNKFKVEYLEPGMPAASEAILAVGTEIVKLDDEELALRTLTEVKILLQGSIGTTLRVQTVELATASLVRVPVSERRINSVHSAVLKRSDSSNDPASVAWQFYDSDVATHLIGDSSDVNYRHPASVSPWIRTAQNTMIYAERHGQLMNAGRTSAEFGKDIQEQTARIAAGSMVWVREKPYTCPEQHFAERGLLRHRCIPCRECDYGEYRVECGGPVTPLQTGKCVSCEATVCATGMVQTACINRVGFSAAPTCQFKQFLTRTPLCQDDGDRGLGLGGFTLADVFNTFQNQTRFQCSRVCDSRTRHDTMQCDGPFACNRMACSMDSDSDVGNLAEFMVPKACPVTLTEKERLSPGNHLAAVNAKRAQTCQTCADCGHSANNDNLADWGRGCAGECSMTQCLLGQIWDWTQRKCVTCDTLRNGSLCTSTAWQGMRNEDVSGHRAKIAFRKCVAKPSFGATDKITYGDCGSCRDDHINEECLASVPQYHASCSIEQSQCQPCRERTNMLLGNSHYLDGTGATLPLYCQVSACTEGFTGVKNMGLLCFDECVSGSCAAGDISLPCVLPHNARCTRGHPRSKSGQQATSHVYMPAHANLLEHIDSAQHQYSSFENILIAKDSLSKHQCVWNARDIRDNDMNPGGISSTFFAPAVVLSDLGEGGSQFCHSWLRNPRVTYPQLPLQNTVTFDSSSPRRVILNASARVMAYTYTGIGLPDVGDQPGTARQIKVDPPDEEAHVFAGDLYMSIDMRNTPDATLSVFMPRDRNLDQAWIPAYLFTCIVMESSFELQTEPLGVTLHTARGFPRDTFALNIEAGGATSAQLTIASLGVECGQSNVKYTQGLVQTSDVWVSTETAKLDDPLLLSAFPEMYTASREIDADVPVYERKFGLPTNHDIVNTLYSINSHGFRDCDVLTLQTPTPHSTQVITCWNVDPTSPATASVTTIHAHALVSDIQHADWTIEDMDVIHDQLVLTVFFGVGEGSQVMYVDKTSQEMYDVTGLESVGTVLAMAAVASSTTSVWVLHRVTMQTQTQRIVHLDRRTITSVMRVDSLAATHVDLLSNYAADPSVASTSRSKMAACEFGDCAEVDAGVDSTHRYTLAACDLGGCEENVFVGIVLQGGYEALMLNENTSTKLFQVQCRLFVRHDSEFATFTSVAWLTSTRLLLHLHGQLYTASCEGASLVLVGLYVSPLPSSAFVSRANSFFSLDSELSLLSYARLVQLRDVALLGSCVVNMGPTATTIVYKADTCLLRGHVVTADGVSVDTLLDKHADTVQLSGYAAGVQVQGIASLTNMHPLTGAYVRLVLNGAAFFDASTCATNVVCPVAAQVHVRLVCGSSVEFCGDSVSNTNSPSEGDCPPVTLTIHVREWTYDVQWYVSAAKLVWKNEGTGEIDEVIIESVAYTVATAAIALREGAYVSLIHGALLTDGTVFVRETAVAPQQGEWRRARLLAARQSINRFVTAQQLSVKIQRPESIADLTTSRSVSLDALQLLVVLTVDIAREIASCLMVRMYLPTYIELRTVDLENALFPDVTGTVASSATAAPQTHWQRLYVTAGLQTHNTEQVDCVYRIRVVTLDSSNELLQSPASSMLTQAGCTLTIQADGMGECVLEVPAWLGNTQRYVGLTAEVAADGTDAVCKWPDRDLFTAVIVPYTMMHTCDVNFFWSEDQAMCVTCDFTGSSILAVGDDCAAGNIVLGCMSLDYDTSAGACRPCETYGRAVDTYTWTTGVCQYQCVSTYYRHEQLCLPCTAPQCTPGFVLRACTNTADASCAKCSDIAHGIYSNNEEFVDACITQCKLQYFRVSSSSACKACKTVAQEKALLDLKWGADRTTFYQFESCNPESHDTRSSVCTPVTNGAFAADADGLDEHCALTCNLGYFRTGQTCVACTTPTGVTETDAGLAALPVGAYTWSEPECGAYTCKEDADYYMRNGQCVYCGATCNVGEYRGDNAGQYLCSQCLPCQYFSLTEGVSGSRTFTTKGTVDNPASCGEACTSGHFADFERCVEWATPVCVQGTSYKIAGTSTADAICWPCTACRRGESEAVACSTTADTTCTSCGSLPLYSQYTIGCATECVANAVTITGASENVRMNPPEASRSYSNLYNGEAPGTGHTKSMLGSTMAWLAAAPGTGEWMQIDLGLARTVSGIVVQKRNGLHQQHVTQLSVSTSTDGTTFNEDGLFSMSYGGTMESEHLLVTAVTARYVRFTVEAWNSYPSMRAGVLVQAAGAASTCALCPSECGNREYRAAPSTSCTCSACTVPPTNAEFSRESGCVWGCSSGYSYSSDGACVAETDHDPAPAPLQLQVECQAREFLDSEYQCKPCADLGIKTPDSADEDRTWRWKPYGMAVCVFECIDEHFEYSRVDGSKFCYSAAQYEAHVLLLKHTVPVSLAQGFAVTAVPAPDAHDITLPPALVIVLCTVGVIFLVFATLVL